MKRLMNSMIVNTVAMVAMYWCEELLYTIDRTVFNWGIPPIVYYAELILVLVVVHTSPIARIDYCGFAERIISKLKGKEYIRQDKGTLKKVKVR